MPDVVCGKVISVTERETLHTTYLKKVSHKNSKLKGVILEGGFVLVTASLRITYTSTLKYQIRMT